LFDISCPSIFSTFDVKATSSQIATEELFTFKSIIGVFKLSQARVTKYLDQVISSEVVLSSLLSFITTTK
jgi:hypothetical protein